MKKLIDAINLAFEYFFYNIFISKWSIDLSNIRNYGREESNGDKNESNNRVLGFPTDLFYNYLKNSQGFANQLAVDLGIINFPLYSSNKNNLIFLYGEAHLNRKCALVSTYNLGNFQSIISNEYNRFEKRIIKESIHEIGHLILGIEHCINSECVMNYSDSLKKVDKKNMLPCDCCNDKLESIRENYNF